MAVRPWVTTGASVLSGALVLVLAWVGYLRRSFLRRLAWQRSAAQREEARYRKLLEISPDAVLVCREGRVKLANPAAARLFQMADAGHLGGKSVGGLLAPESRELAARLQGGPDASALPATGRIWVGDGLRPEVELAGYSYWEGEVTAVLREVAADDFDRAVFHPGTSEPLPVRAQAPIPTPPAVPGVKRRILVAEDNPTNQEVILAMLMQLGYETRAVPNGARAIDELRQADFDLVLMDCWMPDMDGYEATRLIRQPETGARNPAVPILALTADAMPHVREDCLRVGMNDHLTKPVDIRELRLRLAKWLPEPEVAPSRAPVFDREDLLDRLMGNADLAHRVVDRFLLNAPEQLRALAEAVSSWDGEKACKAAHSIKGVAANAGGARLSDAARRLEELGRSGNLAGAGELVAGLTVMLDDYRTEAAKFSAD